MHTAMPHVAMKVYYIFNINVVEQILHEYGYESMDMSCVVCVLCDVCIEITFCIVLLVISLLIIIYSTSILCFIFPGAIHAERHLAYFPVGFRSGIT